MYYLGNLYIGTKSKCLFDGKQIIDKYNWIPKECNPVSIISTRFSVAGQLVLRTETSHSYNENDIVQIILQINTGNQKSTTHHANTFPEAIISYSVLVLNSVELKLLNLIAGEVERNLTMLLHASSIYVRPIHCENALFPGERCHPHRYNGTISRFNTLGYFSSASRTTCPYVMPCEPSSSCVGNGQCAFGYVSYYEPYRNDGACDPLHYTLPDSTCFAPRCGLCDISESNPHFRLDGICIACPEIPWLMPVIMGFACIIGIVAMVVLSKSKIDRNVLRIGIDYFQVLAMFRTAKVAWPIEINFIFKWFQFFQMDIDLVGPECKYIASLVL